MHHFDQRVNWYFSGESRDILKSDSLFLFFISMDYGAVRRQLRLISTVRPTVFTKRELFENALQPGGIWKRLRLDVKHFWNGAFWKWLRRDNVMSLTAQWKGGLSRNLNVKHIVIFQIEIWKISCVVYLSQTTQDLVISCGCFAEHGEDQGWLRSHCTAL